MKLEDLLNLWLEKYAKLSIKPRSYNKYEAFITLHINPILGNIPINEITSNMLQDFILQKLENGNLKTNKPLSVNTVFGIVSVLKQAFKLALTLDLIRKDPTVAIKLPQQQEKEIQALTRDEQKRIEEYCLKQTKNNYIGIIICLYTGIRLGELLALTWDDIDFEKKFLYIKKTAYKIKINGKNQMVIDKPKTKKSNRIIPLPDKLLNLLQLSKNKSNSYYILSTKTNNMVDIRSYQRTFESILNKCGIKHYNFHCLRHTFATRALELGMDIKTLSEILGHTNVAITLNRYAHSLLEYKILEMNKISSLL